MKHILLVIITFFVLILVSFGQTKAELEEQRKRTLNEISYVDNLLKTTSREKTQSLNSLKIIGRKLTLREEVIKGMKEEVNLLEERISLNKTAIDLMELDLMELKKDYALAVINSYKSHKMNLELIYVLSARDFNQGYKRLKYLKQAAKFRRNESEIISEIKSQIEQSKADLEKDLLNISELKTREEQQKGLLQGEQKRKQTIVKSLGNKEKQLKKELEDKKRIAKKIESEIAKLIEEERKKSLKTDMTPDQKLIGDNFSDNKGLLPWPVEKGIITGHFGVQNHPVLKYVTEDNIGIEITSSGVTPARAIFKGEVVRVFAISGANMAIIIRHGKYLSVYQNIVNVKVKSGQRVEARQEIGNVFCETGDDDNAIMKLMIFEEKEKLNPEIWLSKKK
jgi:septal ring factor EnvC (AmiA/AmiB activator)